MRRQHFPNPLFFLWGANIFQIRLFFCEAPTFSKFANFSVRRQNFPNPPIFLWGANIFQIPPDFSKSCKYLCIFSVFIYAFKYAPVFWRNCFDLGFKIDIVVIIIWNIVIIINFVLTLSVYTASLSHDREPRRLCSTTLVRFIPAFARGPRRRRIRLVASDGGNCFTVGGFPSNPIPVGVCAEQVYIGHYILCSLFSFFFSLISISSAFYFSVLYLNYSTVYVLFLLRRLFFWTMCAYRYILLLWLFLYLFFHT